MEELLTVYRNQKKYMRYLTLTDLIAIIPCLLSIYSSVAGNVLLTVLILLLGVSTAVIAIIEMCATGQRCENACKIITNQIMNEENGDRCKTLERLRKLKIPATYLPAEPAYNNFHTTEKNCPKYQCPNCKSKDVRILPYKEPKLDSWFTIWVIGIFLGIKFSPIISCFAFAYWIAVMVSCNNTSRKANERNQIACNLCGTIFEAIK